MAIRSKQMPTVLVAAKSFTAQEGRLRCGQRFTTTEARAIELTRKGYAVRADQAPVQNKAFTPKNKAVVPDNKSDAPVETLVQDQPVQDVANNETHADETGETQAEGDNESNTDPVEAPDAKPAPKSRGKK